MTKLQQLIAELNDGLKNVVLKEFLAGRKVEDTNEYNKIISDIIKFAVQAVKPYGIPELEFDSHGNIRLRAQYSYNVKFIDLKIEFNKDKRIKWYNKKGKIVSAEYVLVASEYDTLSLEQNIAKIIYEANKAELQKRIENCDGHVRHYQSEIENTYAEKAKQQSWLDKVESDYFEYASKQTS